MKAEKFKADGLMLLVTVGSKGGMDLIPEKLLSFYHYSLDLSVYLTHLTYIEEMLNLMSSYMI